MNPAAQYRFDAVPPSATAPGAALNPAQQDTGLAGNGSTVDRSAEENHSHAADMEPVRTEPMSFPGPYAYAPAPVVAEQPAQAGGATTHATAAATTGSSIGTTPHAPAGAPANSALPEVAGSQHFGQSAPAEGRQDNTDGLPSLIHAATLGDLDRLRMLLAQPGADVNQVMPGPATLP